MGKKRLAIAAVVVLLIVGSVAVLWHVLDWPPPRLILKYGFPPAGRLTGRTWTNSIGMEFHEVSEGYCHVRRNVWNGVGGKPPALSEDRWMEVDEAFWISRSGVPFHLVTGHTGVLESAAWSGVCSHLSSLDPGTYAAPSREQLYLASTLGVPGSSGYALASDNGHPMSLMVLYGRSWSSFSGSVEDVFAQQDRELTPIDLRLVWEPPDGFVFPRADDGTEAPNPDEPPAHLVEKYGPPPAGGPTGRRRTALGIEFIELSPGYFLMGSRESESERPPHWVEIDYSYWIAKTEITEDQYEYYWGTRTLAEIEDGSPKVLSWLDAIDFCEWGTDRLAGATVRLPSEAEWEYACRAGTTTRFFTGGESSSLEGFANMTSQLAPVGSFRPNPWGLFDMHGNVSEWCQDSWHISYRGAPTGGDPWVDAPGHPGGSERVVRGGSRIDPPDTRTAASRIPRNAANFHRWIGFRPVAIFPEER